MTATEGARWVVSVGDSVVSQHSQLHTALERAIAEETRSPADSTLVTHVAEIRVECPETWVVPSDTVVVDTVAVAVDSARLWPDSVAFRTAVDAAGDTTWTWEAWAEDAGSLSLVDSGTGRQYQFSFLLYEGGELRFCAGWCGRSDWGDPIRLAWSDAKWLARE